MIRLRYFILMALLVGAFSPALSAFSAAEVADFQRANKHYRAGEFKEAAKIYEDLSVKSPETGVLFYNLGNTYYRLGDLGLSILSYERARALDPRNSDIKTNLAYVKNSLEYQVEDKRNWYLRALEQTLRFLTTKEAGLIASFAMLLFLVSWAFALYVRPGLPWGPIRKILLVTALLALGFFSAKHFQIQKFGDAIVMVKSAEVRYAPSKSDQVAFKLGEGLKVYVREQRDDWSRIYVASGETGWIQNDKISKVNQ